MRVFLLIVCLLCYSITSVAQLDFRIIVSGKKEQKAFQKSFLQLIKAFQNNDTGYIRKTSTGLIDCMVCQLEVDGNYPPEDYNVPIDTFLKQYQNVLPVTDLSKAVAEIRYKSGVRPYGARRVFYVLIHTYVSEHEHENQHHEFLFRKVKSKFLLEGVSSTP